MTKENVEIETDEVETEAGDYVTRDELLSTVTEAVREALAGINPMSSDDDDEVVEDTDDDVETPSLSAAQIEKIAEKKVREAMIALGAKKPAPVKKAAAAKKAAPVKKIVETEPRQAGKKSLRGFLWGEN